MVRCDVSRENEVPGALTGRARWSDLPTRLNTKCNKYKGFPSHLPGVSVLKFKVLEPKVGPKSRDAKLGLGESGWLKSRL